MSHIQIHVNCNPEVVTGKRKKGTWRGCHEGLNAWSRWPQWRLTKLFCPLFYLYSFYFSLRIGIEMDTWVVEATPSGCFFINKRLLQILWNQRFISIGSRLYVVREHESEFTGTVFFFTTATKYLVHPYIL